MITHYMESPAGWLRVVVEPSGALSAIRFEDQAPPHPSSSDRAVEPVVRQLQEYFAGERRMFDLELSPRGTEFQQQVWKALSAIPWGRTCSYADLARTIGKPAAVRAVGQANARNRIPIVIPCHRVIGADGSLAGYSAGSARKIALLQIEGFL